MKKFSLKVMMVLICVFSLVTVFGCSCSKPAKVMYAIKVTKSDGSVFDENMEVKALIKKKFREPANTPCYEKIDDDSYELILDASEVSQCYDANGNKFEKATHNMAEDAKLDERYPIHQRTNEVPVNEAFSSLLEVPSNGQYSLIYIFTIENRSNEMMYIKALTKADILAGVVKEEALDKITVKQDSDISIINNVEYYAILGDSEFEIKIEIKNLLLEDLDTSKSENLVLNINLEIKA